MMRKGEVVAAALLVVTVAITGAGSAAATAIAIPTIRSVATAAPFSTAATTISPGLHATTLPRRPPHRQLHPMPRWRRGRSPGGRGPVRSVDRAATSPCQPPPHAVLEEKGRGRSPGREEAGEIHASSTTIAVAATSLRRPPRGHHLTRTAQKEGASTPATTSPGPAGSSPAPAGLLHHRATLEEERMGRAPGRGLSPVLVGHRRSSCWKAKGEEGRERDVARERYGKMWIRTDSRYT
uniref:Uncharacterized protein n=1 Tax=Oryza punctata TaxID=4537 RepID=A0A0E0KM80_ORYPU